MYLLRWSCLCNISLCAQKLCHSLVFFRVMQLGVPCDREVGQQEMSGISCVFHLTVSVLITLIFTPTNKQLDASLLINHISEFIINVYQFHEHAHKQLQCGLQNYQAPWLRTVLNVPNAFPHAHLHKPILFWRSNTKAQAATPLI